VEPQASDHFAVWLDCAGDPPENEAEVMHALACITGDWFTAYCLISGRDESSIRPWKGVVAAPVTRDAAKVIVDWLAFVGARAFIDDGHFGENDQAEVSDA
jgi:hypothetical protein